MKLNAKSGATIAAAAAALVVAGAATAPQAFAGDKGHCVGANACKGHGACKTANNACAGKNACKGTGFIKATKEECDAMKKDFPDAKFEEPKKS